VSSTGSEAAAVQRPDTLEEAAGLLRDGSGSVLIRGGGTKMSWAGTPRPADLVLHTAGLSRLLSHNPADMTVRVEGGMPLRALQEALAGAGQWLALDPATQDGGATVGGVLATGDFGPRRLRYGAVRDLVIGVTLVLADGTVARAGGQVIKNVAGYDLGKLACGSLGTLALVAEVALRVHPLPRASATLAVRVPLPAAVRMSLHLLGSPLEPSAVAWDGDPGAPATGAGPVGAGPGGAGPGSAGPGGAGPGGAGPGGAAGRFAVRFEGSDAGVAAQADACAEILGGPLPGGPLPGGRDAQVERLAGAAESALWADLAGRWRGAPGQSVAFAGTLPGQTTAVGAALAEAGEAAGAGVRLVSQVALGLHTAHFGGQPAAQAAAFDRWRQAVLAAGGTVLLRDRPPAVDQLLDPLGPPPSAAALLRAVKARLDPQGRLAPGRLGSWL
jgi:glycolate oxidase FAD binding subunit